MSIFEVMGPIMVGPSSSHTAGPVKIGRIASLIFNEPIDEVNIYFHGSFARTYKGHGTDRAVIGGILGYRPDNESIKNSIALARDKGIKINFEEIQLQDAHPNTIIIQLINEENSVTVKSSSIGGGKIIVQEINNYTVNISGTYPTLWILHRDKPGIIGAVTSRLGKFNLNIAFMQVFRKNRGSLASCIIEMDHDINNIILKHLKSIADIKQIRYIPAL